MIRQQPDILESPAKQVVDHHELYLGLVTYALLLARVASLPVGVSYARYVLASNLVDDRVAEKTRLLWKFSMCLTATGGITKQRNHFLK
jgi:hypothetical protein